MYCFTYVVYRLLILYYVYRLFIGVIQSCTRARLLHSSTNTVVLYEFMNDYRLSINHRSRSRISSLTTTDSTTNTTTNMTTNTTTTTTRLKKRLGLCSRGINSMNISTGEAWYVNRFTLVYRMCACVTLQFMDV